MREEANIFDMIAMSLMTFIIAFISYRDQSEKALLSSVIVCFIFVAIMFIYERKLINSKLLNYAVFAVCLVEMGINANTGVKTVTVTGYGNYPRNSESVSDLINSVESEDKGFYRLETMTNYTINDPALYGYKGVSQFSSTANVNVSNIMKSLGLQASAAGNRYYYNQNTAVINMFLNLKYLISHDSYSGDLTYLDPLASKDGVSIYKNNHYLPIGFAAESSISEYKGESFIQFENQNELFRLATGIEEDVLTRVDIKDVGHKGLNVIKSGYGNYSYQYSAPDDGSEDCYLKFNFTVPNDGPLYVTFDFGEIKNVRIKVGDSVLRTHNSGKYMDIFAAGDFNAGDVVSFQADAKDQKNGSGTIYVYQINSEVFERGYQKLLSGAMNVTEYDDTSIKGSITAENDCLMYTSIPYDGGWKAYVDGKETKVAAINKAFVSVPLTAGEHTIELKYCPPGFAAGAVISVLSVAALVMLWIFVPKLKKKKHFSEEETAENK